MPKKRRGNQSSARGVTAARASRLCRLLKLLDAEPQTRSLLIGRLRLDLRGFYRDLHLLRASGIHVVLRQRKYTLKEKPDVAMALLPFPDPCLTLGEAMQLAKGKNRAHAKLKKQIGGILRG